MSEPNQQNDPAAISASAPSPNGPPQESSDATSIKAGPPPPAKNPEDVGNLGHVTVERFPTMCNVTLHWQKVAPALREEIEDELRRNLDECRALDNPSAGWFLGMSSLLFFLSIALIVFYILLSFPRR